jgi:pimeloyl-ACP methyl ester carboxylesterase
MLKYLKYIAVLLVFVFGFFLAWGWASDIPPEKLAEKYAGGASDFLELPSGDTAHYRMQGNDEGRTIVLLHGSNASLHTWEPWVEGLEADHLVITVDLPGHGLTGSIKSGEYGYNSMAGFVKEVMDTLGIERFVLGGNSMGGGVAATFALQHPEMLDAILLLDASGVKLPEEAQAKSDPPLAFKLAGKWYANWILEHVTPRSIAAEGLAKSFTDQSLIDDAMIDRYWELVRHPGNRRATAIRFASYRNSPLHLPVEEINVPTLILWGADDKLIPVEAAYEFHRRIGGSELVVFDGVGHIPMEEIPEDSLKAVQAFLDR